MQARWTHLATKAIEQQTSNCKCLERAAAEAADRYKPLVVTFSLSKPRRNWSVPVSQPPHRTFMGMLNEAVEVLRSRLFHISDEEVAHLQKTAQVTCLDTPHSGTALDTFALSEVAQTLVPGNHYQVSERGADQGSMHLVVVYGLPVMTQAVASPA